jgi:hypothetical protein
MKGSSRIAMTLVAAALAAGAGLTQAQTSSSAGSTAAAGSGVEFTTGGVGLDARQALANQAGQYNLHLEFAAVPAGEYLSAVDVTITDARGTEVLKTRTDGPWLLARLPAGNYSVTARYGSSVQRQQVSVGGGKRHLVVRFPAAAEQIAGATTSGR